MHMRRIKVPQTESPKASFTDQHFLLNFIMSTYLGPDVYSDNPRCSAFCRLAEGFPPYTLNNLGSSFLSISQLESLYYYVLRNAHASLVLQPNMFYAYLKGNLGFPSSRSVEEYKQFTSLFPLNLHDHKRYSPSYEIVKGIVLIDDPITSHMKQEDLERFRCLSGVQDLKIDREKCLSYQHGFQIENGGQESEPSDVTNNDRDFAGSLPNVKGISSVSFPKTYKRRRRLGHALQHTPERMSNVTEPLTMPITALPKTEHCSWDESVVLTGTARMGIAGPPIGVVDIGVSKAAYFFQIALPGVRRDFCQFSCEIESDGKVHIEGSTTGGKTIKKRSRVFQMKFQQLCPPGPFTISFNLPGPVDPRLFSPNFRSDGIFEAVVIKQKRNPAAVDMELP